MSRRPPERQRAQTVSELQQALDLIARGADEVLKADELELTEEELAKLG